MPADNDLDPVDRWLNQQVWPIAPPDGTFERITRRARRRKVRTAAISVASSAVVAVAVAVGATLGLAGGLGSSGPGRVVIAGSQGTTPSGGSSQSELGTGTADATPSGTGKASVQPTSTGSSSSTLGPNSPGWLPGQFIPATSTWVSDTTGYVMGQAGTPGQCGAQQNSSICTSIAITRDSGQTWAGVAAPVTRAASGLSGVSGLRFLNGADGWAYGPELWSTHDGGLNWTQINTGGLQVTDLETVNDRAYALFANCTSANACFSYTLKSTLASEDVWTPVSGVPANLTAGGTTAGTANIELAADSGYLVAPDGTLYVGTLPGRPNAGAPSTWHKATDSLPCAPSAQLEGLYGQSLKVLLTPYWGGTGNPQALALVCEVPALPQGFTSTVWISTDSGASWAQRTSVGKSGYAIIGKVLSLTATTGGTLIAATQTGIYWLPPGVTQWQKSPLSGATAPPYGFSYVGMTTAMQGVAIADPAAALGQPSPDPYGIWMTFDGGQTWQFHKIQS